MYSSASGHGSSRNSSSVIPMCSLSSLRSRNVEKLGGPCVPIRTAAEVFNRKLAILLRGPLLVLLLHGLPELVENPGGQRLYVLEVDRPDRPVVIIQVPGLDGRQEHQLPVPCDVGGGNCLALGHDDLGQCTLRTLFGSLRDVLGKLNPVVALLVDNHLVRALVSSEKAHGVPLFSGMKKAPESVSQGPVQKNSQEETQL